VLDDREISQQRRSMEEMISGRERVQIKTDAKLRKKGEERGDVTLPITGSKSSHERGRNGVGAETKKNSDEHV